MRAIIYDVETDNLLLDATRMWCLVGQDLHSGEVTAFTPENIHEAYAFLCQADRLIGHNCIGFDDPVSCRLLNHHSSDGFPVSIDTMLLSRLVYPDRKNNPIGGHSLEAWGKYLKCHKGDYTDFSQYTSEMLEYCKQDVKVTEKIYRYLLPKAKEMPEAVKLEHRVASIITKQIQNGFTLHKENHDKLTQQLMQDRAALMDKLVDIPPFVDYKTMKKRWWVDMAGNKYATKKEAPKSVQKELVQGEPIVKKIETSFNHQSGDHIARYFKEQYDWEPTEFSETGKPKTSRDVLKKLKYPEAKTLTKLSAIDKVLGTYANAWYEHERDGKIHGQIITNGAVTGRMTHHSPNLNVPKVKKDDDNNIIWGFDGKYGADCRSCFRARDGWKLVGCDASGLEARMLAHYMARWDNGEFGREILKSDIHTVNQRLAGLGSRDQAKTLYYAFMYGGGNTRLGDIVNGGAKEGQMLKDKFFAAAPAIRNLIEWVKREVKTRERLIGLDGRILPIRSDHSALNTLLQSAGAVVMKQALVFFYDSMVEAYGPHGERWGLCANVHDEFQTECEPEIAEEVGKLAMNSITRAGEHFNLAIRLDGEYKVGENWCDTH